MILDIEIRGAEIKSLTGIGIDCYISIPTLKYQMRKLVGQKEECSNVTYSNWTEWEDIPIVRE